MTRGKVIESGIASGLDYLIVGMYAGFRNGYVRVPESHPWHEDGQRIEDAVEVHGGVTYTGKELPEAEGWWVGFDTAHSGDGRDASLYDDEHREYPWPTSPGDVIRTTEYVRDQCERLARQIAEADR